MNAKDQIQHSRWGACLHCLQLLRALEDRTQKLWPVSLTKRERQRPVLLVYMAGIPTPHPWDIAAEKDRRATALIREGWE
jgi:hypothetical protein